jgi:hypothetical protein
VEKRNNCTRRRASHWRSLRVVAVLIAIAAVVTVATVSLGTAVAADAVLYTCPVDVQVQDTSLCGDGSLIVLLRLPIDSTQFVPILQHELPDAQKRDAIERRRNPALPDMIGRLAELDRKVQVLKSFPNAFVLRFKNGLATQQRLYRLTYELCYVLQGSRGDDVGGCEKPWTRVRLEPTFKLHAYAEPPNDPSFESEEPKQWNLQNGNGIKARAAWDRTGTVTGLQPVRVAVLDTGVEPIANELDGGLMVDGADFTPTDPLLGMPAAGGDHGTEVASVIAARANNGNDMAGVTWAGAGQGNLATLMPIKIMSAARPVSKEQCTNNLLNALPYAVDPNGEVDAGSNPVVPFWDLTKLPDSNHRLVRPARGSKIVNLSAGFDNCSPALGEAFRRIGLVFPDVLFVVAVPNLEGIAGTEDIDSTPSNSSYPTSYQQDGRRFSNILSVTATNKSQCVSEKYGKTSVDIAAPGDAVVVLQKSHTGAQTDTGTSFAAPQVSGAAALLKALAPPDWGYEQVRQYLLASSDTTMCSDKSPPLGCGGADNYPTVCRGVAHGLLDLDAATGPPVKGITALSNVDSDTTVAWTTAMPATVSWQRAFPSGQCTQVDVDLVVDQSTGGTKAAKLSTTPVDVDAGSALFGAATLATAASAAMPSGSEPAQARVRLQCVGSHMFRTSQDFTLRRAQ